MIGLILCGGQSSRMGSDKGLLTVDGKTWASTARLKLQALHIPVYISVNNEQLAPYSAVFPDEALICDNTALLLNGPLLGIISAHIAWPGEDLFVLACDMLQMETGVLEKLFKYYQQQKPDACVYSADDNAEPLCGIYAAKGLSAVLSMYQNKTLTKHSMKFILECLQTVYIPLAGEDIKCFRNFNGPGDLSDLDLIY